MTTKMASVRNFYFRQCFCAKNDSEDLVTDDKLTIISKFVDHNLRKIQFGCYTIGIIGIFVIFRSLRVTARFTRSLDIPEEFIKKQVRLYGVVHGVRLDGTLCIKHKPILSFSKDSGNDPSQLKIKLYGLDVAVNGIQWMEQNVRKQAVSFRLLQRQDDLVSCALYTKTIRPWQKCLNVRLAELGLGTVLLPKEEPSNKFLAKLCHSLQKAELKARRKGLGIWMQDSTAWKLSPIHWLSKLKNAILRRKQ